MRLKPDTKLRKAWFVGDAMSHPAKGHLGLWWEILERYTEPGQTVLDPMAGIGSTLMACLMGRNVICNEMETHFLEPMAASWAKMQRVGPMLGHQIGRALIIRGDARCLPLAGADAIVTSPPYEASATDQKDRIDWEKQADGRKKQEPHGVGGKPFGYTVPDAIVTSPPYADMADAKRHPGGGLEAEKHHVLGYTQPEAIVTSPPYEEHHQGGENKGRLQGSQNGLVSHRYTQVEAVVSSPPYEQAQTGGGIAVNGYRGSKQGPTDLVGQRSYMPQNHSVDATNIGNLRGAKYWEAMEAVYRECHRVLAGGSSMVLVVKGCTRDKKYVDLPQQTADLIETLGFQVFDRWTREVPLSFWRTLQKQNGNWDEALRYEHVIAARKLKLAH